MAGARIAASARNDRDDVAAAAATSHIASCDYHHRHHHQLHRSRCSTDDCQRSRFVTMNFVQYSLLLVVYAMAIAQNALRINPILLSVSYRTTKRREYPHVFLFSFRL